MAGQYENPHPENDGCFDLQYTQQQNQLGDLVEARTQIQDQVLVIRSDQVRDTYAVFHQSSQPEAWPHHITAGRLAFTELWKRLRGQITD